MNNFKGPLRYVMTHTKESREAMDILRLNHVNLQDFIRDALVTAACTYKKPRISTKTVTSLSFIDEEEVL